MEVMQFNLGRGKPDNVLIFPMFRNQGKSMETQVAKIETTRRGLASVIARIVEIEAKAQSREWPHAHLTGLTRAYAIDQITVAHGIIAIAAGKLGFKTENMTLEAVDGSAVTCFYANCMVLAQVAGCSKEDAEEAVFQSIRKLQTQACEIIRHVDNVIEGDETIDGREIRHGALHYK